VAGVPGAGDGVTAGVGVCVCASLDGVLGEKIPAIVTRFFCGIRDKMAKATTPRTATLAVMHAAARVRLGPRSCSRVSLAETSSTRASAVGWRPRRNARAWAGVDWVVKLSRLRYRLVTCGDLEYSCCSRGSQRRRTAAAWFISPVMPTPSARSLPTSSRFSAVTDSSRLPQQVAAT
jgi:hypothetical protein